MIERIIVGRIVGQHGVQGHLKILFSKKTKDFFKGTWLYLDIQSKPVPFFIEECWGNEFSWVVKLKGIDSPETAAEFNGTEIGLDPNQIDADSVSNKLDDLLGYMVLNANDHSEIGQINNVFDNTAHLLIQVVNQGKETLIPFHENLIVSVNRQERIIILQISEGLFDLGD